MVLLWCKTLDIVVDHRDKHSLVFLAVEDVVAVQVAWVEPRVVRRRELSTALVFTPYVEQTRCASTSSWSSSFICSVHSMNKSRDRIRPPRGMWSGSGVRTPDPDYFRNLTGTSLSSDTSVIKFSSKSDHSDRRYEPNCVKKIPYLAMLENTSKNCCIRMWRRMTPKI